MSAHITAGRCQFNMPVRTALFEAYLRENTWSISSKRTFRRGAWDARRRWSWSSGCNARGKAILKLVSDALALDELQNDCQVPHRLVSDALQA